VDRLESMSNATIKIPFVNVEEHWECSICGQKLEVGAFGCVLYAENVAICPLRAYASGGECVAFRSPQRARMLMAFRAERENLPVEARQPAKT
jgi:hypothetical protein